MNKFSNAFKLELVKVNMYDSGARSDIHDICIK